MHVRACESLPKTCWTWRIPRSTRSDSRTRMPSSLTRIFTEENASDMSDRDSRPWSISLEPRPPSDVLTAQLEVALSTATSASHYYRTWGSDHGTDIWAYLLPTPAADGPPILVALCSPICIACVSHNLGRSQAGTSFIDSKRQSWQRTQKGSGNWGFSRHILRTLAEPIWHLKSQRQMALWLCRSFTSLRLRCRIEGKKD